MSTGNFTFPLFFSFFFAHEFSFSPHTAWNFNVIASLRADCTSARQRKHTTPARRTSSKRMIAPAHAPPSRVLWFSRIFSRTLSKARCSLVWTSMDHSMKARARFARQRGRESAGLKKQRAAEKARAAPRAQSSAERRGKLPISRSRTIPSSHRARC